MRKEALEYFVHTADSRKEGQMKTTHNQLIVNKSKWMSGQEIRGQKECNFIKSYNKKRRVIIASVLILKCRTTEHEEYCAILLSVSRNIVNAYIYAAVWKY